MKQKKLSTRQVEDIVSNHLQESKTKKGATRRRKRLLGYLNYLDRLDSLSEREMELYTNCVENRLTSEEQANVPEDSDKANKYFNDLARTWYFRRSAWEDYLFGVVNEKPLHLP